MDSLRSLRTDGQSTHNERGNECPQKLSARRSPSAFFAATAIWRSKLGETVLVVDDEQTVRMLITDVLEELGYIAIDAPDGKAGLQILESKRQVDLLITDVGLPGGMNGRQLADAGTALRSGLKVLFITGYAENAVIGDGHLKPGMHVLTKPFGMDALANRITSILNSH